MSTKEETQEPKINKETGLPEGLDPGHDYMDGTPEMKSEPIPLPYGSRLVGLTPEEAHDLIEKEEAEQAEALKAEEEAQKKAERTSASKSS